MINKTRFIIAIFNLSRNSTDLSSTPKALARARATGTTRDWGRRRVSRVLMRAAQVV